MKRMQKILCAARSCRGNTFPPFPIPTYLVVFLSRNYSSLTGLQVFPPARGCLSADGCFPLEFLIVLRCESDVFDRLVPKTNATFHYDNFTRLRLRNEITSAT